MKRPAVKTKRYLDWVELKPFLQKKYPKLKLDKIVGLWADYGDISNGCFKSVERVDEPGIYEPEIEALSEALFEEFPEAVDHYDTIEIYVWW